MRAAYLLAALPLITPKLTVLDSLKPVALEAVRTYRKIRNTLPLVHDQLRKIKQHYGGQLTLTEIIRDESKENEDYFGPAGFKGRGKDGVETRDHTFGTFTGHTSPSSRTWIRQQRKSRLPRQGSCDGRLTMNEFRHRPPPGTRTRLREADGYAHRICPALPGS
jgi:hypothetical protein